MSSWFISRRSASHHSNRSKDLSDELGDFTHLFVGVLKTLVMVVGLSLALTSSALAQQDQGAITGTVQDPSGAAIPHAHVILTSTDTGQVLETSCDAVGVYIFSPVKIGNYQVSASAPGFETTTQLNLRLNLQERLNVVLTLKPGNVTATVTVTEAPPLLQAGDGSVGQVLSTSTINDTPLNGRNWVFIAQLTAGADPGTGARGQGDFDANGQRAEQNNFVLDGVDNNTSSVDFLNGSSYVVRPPPDALAEFKIQTADYSAEFGHSAGATLNASIKSGTNEIHGDLWEYVRNTALDARNFNALTIPAYHENQFGATLGLPILRNKLFFFGDSEANRIVFGNTTTNNVPTPLMRQGNFSELLSTSLSGTSQGTQLYEPNSGGTVKLTCNGQNNVFCANQIDPVAQSILNLFPLPNANNGDTYNNYVVNVNDRDNTAQADARVDYDISSRDQAFARYSYDHEIQVYPPLFGILDGSAYNADGYNIDLAGNLALSETHTFSPTLINEFRFGYNYLRTLLEAENENTDLSSTLGLGGIPYTLGTGGLPYFSVSGLTAFGTPSYNPSREHENVYQILDNVTKIVSNHALKAGLSLQAFRIATLEGQYFRGDYTFNGQYTSDLKAAFTGSGVADFLADQVEAASLSSPLAPFNDVRWNRAAYVQDDWKVNRRLTLNLGVRYDYSQPMTEMSGRQASFVASTRGIGTGSGTYSMPTRDENVPLSSVFTNLLTAENITPQYVNNPALTTTPKDSFAPRVGLSYQLGTKTVARAGFGVFYGDLENRGGGSNIGDNYPFEFTVGFPAPSCKAGYGNCQSTGLTLESGYSAAIAAGLGNYISTLLAYGVPAISKSPYSLAENFTVERSLSNNLVASVGYVGTVARHLQVVLYQNSAEAVINPNISVQTVVPFPKLTTGTGLTAPVGMSDYNSLQAKIEKRYSNGLNFLATYTWSHSLDDAPTPETTDTAYTNTNLLPISEAYSNSVFDVRQRLTFNGYYELPFGQGRKWLNHGSILNQVIGGWASDLTFVAQTGEPFTVGISGITAAGGLGPYAIPIGNPFKVGGSPNSTNPTITCATSTRNKTHWYNPCAFANPLNGTTIPTSGSGSQITSLSQVLQYQGGRRNDVPGPGWERINMSLFKDFITYREQRMEFRADAFNLLNTPAYNTPSTANDGNNGGLITAPRTFQNYTPDARFFQLSLKYIF